MADDLANRLILANLEDEEVLCCDSPHLSAGELSHDLENPPAVLSPERAQQMAEVLGFLADPNRLRLLSILVAEERCVGDLAELLGMNESAVSHQLRTLRAMRLVNARKQGRHVFYRLHDHHVLGLYQAIVDNLVDHLDEHLNESSG
jgi:ArsR family transcriptional regulator, lead/cadmium/zinc/bismuth-responsive transcriptional repressor